MPELEGISPIVAVRDLDRTLAFYVDVLGWEIRTREGDFALVAREGAAVSLLAGDDPAALAATAHHVSAYIRVRDLGTLWGELAPALATLPEGRVRAPFTQAYGMREFHVKDPDGFLIFFGEPAT